MKKTVFAITAAMALSAGTVLPAFGHHSAARFDFTIRDKEVTGIVKEFTVRNPHTTIILEVTDDKGTREIEFEGHSRNNYYRAGWRAGMVEEGDEITVQIAPRKDGSDGGYALNVITEDGTKF